MTDFRAARQASVIGAFPDGVDALLVTHLPNIRWLTGFTGSAALLVLAPDRTTLITDFRYASQAPNEVGGAAEVIIDRNSVWDRLRRVLESAGLAALAVESHVMPLRDSDRLASIFRGRIVPAADLVEQLRQVKDETEVSAIRAAATLCTEALAAVLPTVAIGDREIDLAARLESALRMRGSEWHPFETIVASGPRAALPHAHSSSRTIGRGELLLIDFGARVDGYCADITRTVAIGRPDERQQVVYDLVREAQLRAREGLRSGMSGRD
ncbi:MAG: Xaa-Pro peptidase family protein, partial [Gemmatimonadota bacterium]